MNWRPPSIWKDSECWILGGGPSIFRQFDIPDDVVRAVTLKELPPSTLSEYLSPIHDKHVIGVNNAYQIGTWIDAVFFGDCSWYLTHRRKLAQWPGLKVTSCNRFENNSKRCREEHIKYMGRDKSRKHGISKRLAWVAWNQNSGSAAISLAAHLGANRIILLGFDMDVDKDTKVTHWHGSHGRPGHRTKRPPFRRHMMGFKQIAADAKKMGIKIINASPKSKIVDLPKASVKELL